MPTLSIYPKRPRRNKLAQPPSTKPLRIYDRACNVKLNRFERDKSQLFDIINRDLNALYAANDTAEDYTLSDIEKAHDTFVASGLMYRILMAKRV